MVFVLVGCGGPREVATTPRALGLGDRAIVATATTLTVDGRAESLPSGSEVRIGEPTDWVKTSGDLSVVVLTGPLQGKAGTLLRSALAPLPESRK